MAVLIAEHYDSVSQAGYVMVDGSQLCFDVILVVGNLGPRARKRVRYLELAIVGVAIGC